MLFRTRAQGYLYNVRHTFSLELAHDARAMDFHGFFADSQTRGGLLIGQPFDYEIQNLGFAGQYDFSTPCSLQRD